MNRASSQCASRLVRPFVALAATLLFAGPALADTVKLKNGDTLTGKVVDVSGGKLTFKTDAAGEMKIDVAQIETLTTDDPIQVDLKDGSHVSGKAATATGGAFVLETEKLGKQTIALADVKGVNQPPRHWTGSIVGAATWTRGNSKLQSVASDLNAINRGDEDRLSFAGWYRASRSEDPSTGVTSTTERKVGASLKYDYFFGGSKAYAYANSLAEKDTIAAIDLRYIAGVGAGYQFFEDDKTMLSAEAGASWFNENYSDATPTVDAVAARAAFHVTRKLGGSVSFFDDTDVYKIFAAPRDYLVHSKGGFREQFTPSFFAQEWVDYTWDPTPAAGKKRVDVVYYVGIGWTF
jgi:putative salt-induced outer membrane protein YdiY